MYLADGKSCIPVEMAWHVDVWIGRWESGWIYEKGRGVVGWVQVDG